ncbi:MAG: hypothetical protein QE271_03970 [Bacteriovoracaceae bacterium]|nr:hypothetical protein [Bacteriovoracaceae bacterium]
MNKILCYLLFINVVMNIAWSQTEIAYPWKDAPLMQIKALKPFIPGPEFPVSAHTYFEDFVVGQEILAIPGLVTQAEFYQMFADQKPTHTSYINYRNVFWKKMLTLVATAKMLDGEAYQSPQWQELPRELGDYASVYILIYYAEEILKLDLSKNIPSYESIYQRIKSEAPKGVGLSIDWKWCKYSTKSICDILAKKYPPFADQYIEFDVMPENWNDFHAAVVDKMRDFVKIKARASVIQNSLEREVQKYLSVSRKEKNQSLNEIYKNMVNKCKDQAAPVDPKSLCAIIKNETFTSKRVQDLLEKFWMSIQEGRAWKDTLKSLTAKYGIYETINFCGIAETDDQFFCNTVTESDITSQSKDMYLLLLGLGG